MALTLLPISTVTLSHSIRLTTVLTLLFLAYLPPEACGFTNEDSCLILDDGAVDCSAKGLSFVPRDIPPTTRML